VDTSVAPYPAHDTYCPIMSLPHVMGTSLDTVPGRVPYLRVPVELQESWREKLAQIGGLRVGIVWAGNPLHKNDESRSLPLAALAPLAEIPGVSLLSLQKGHGERQLQEVSFAVTPFGDQVQDFADSGAILQQLDVLISVDTSVAHLAGALGVNTYLLLPNSPDWRWLLDRDDTPWYPGMRLFRQAKAGVWDDVLASVAESVRSLSAARR
ncbi:glycosyltransferase family 9 protein, partial [Acidithiobacillus ferrooxidans]|nr:glycosyltransferase family 9 protein [Acidithiobacillus ferrooxidans]